MENHVTSHRHSLYGDQNNPIFVTPWTLDFEDMPSFHDSNDDDFTVPKYEIEDDLLGILSPTPNHDLFKDIRNSQG
jgi:hypothetical protein